MRKCAQKKHVERAGHRWQYGAFTLHAGYLRLQIHTLRLYNTHCFSTATMVARTRRYVTSHVHNLSCLDCFSSLFAIVLHVPWKKEVSREHLSMCCSDVLIEFLPRAIHEYLTCDNCIG